MKFKLIAVGKLKEKYLKQGIDEYKKRMTTMHPLEIIELPDEKIPERASDKEKELVKNKEGEKILARVNPQDKLIVLAIKGKLLTSEELAAKIKEFEIYGSQNVIFVIGGSLGLADEVYKRADLEISFGRFTLPHQLMRLVFCEQIYRAQMINRGSEYHK
ncbi:23S rRNA (pseudouridine(1915)-N(3))-methyltransferase RlmH [Streptococcaceae bacterium ESL0687]|nr:23S rRNA (pseudouridine(1915)-N(3))-methyltransferase RlmH [Streptococcaceae bacterium ESL0687]